MNIFSDQLKKPCIPSDDFLILLQGSARSAFIASEWSVGITIGSCAWWRSCSLFFLGQWLYLRLELNWRLSTTDHVAYAANVCSLLQGSLTGLRTRDTASTYRHKNDGLYWLSIHWIVVYTEDQNWPGHEWELSLSAPLPHCRASF